MADQGALFDVQALEPEILPPQNTGTRGRGRPKGARSQHYLLMEKVLRSFSREILEAVIASAKAGDANAQRLCMERIYPRPLRPPANVELPAQMNTRQEMVAAMQDLLVRAARGDVSLPDAVDLVRICGVIAQAGEVPLPPAGQMPIDDARQILADRLTKLIAAQTENPASECQPPPTDALAGTETALSAQLDALERRVRELGGDIDD